MFKLISLTSKFAFLCISFCLVSFVEAQIESNFPDSWHLLSPTKDKWHGINLNAAYQFLNEKNVKPQKIVIALIGGGIDTNHKDLKNVLWKNKKEIANNNKDDDGNGYIDDINGWNFLGNKNGKHLLNTNYESARIFNRYYSKYQGKDVKINQLIPQEKLEYSTWIKLYEEYLTLKNDYETVEFSYNSIYKTSVKLCTILKVNKFNTAMLQKFNTTNADEQKAKNAYLNFYKTISDDSTVSNVSFLNQYRDYIDNGIKKDMEKYTKKDPRDTSIADMDDDLTDKNYGNNQIFKYPNTNETQIAGVIAATRNNNFGIDGITNQVELMILKAVPIEGDEYDKDIALAIIYAVDNGASIINLGFGKAHSMNKNLVDSAMQYAAKKNVLIVHAANLNDNKEHSSNYYPSPNITSTNKTIQNFIRVGSSTDPQLTKNTVIANFTGLSNTNINVLAPGTMVVSTIPTSTNKESNLGIDFSNGNTIAAAIVSGVAALIRCHFPKLSATQVKQIIETTVYKPFPSFVNKTIDDKLVNIKITETCSAGGIVDAEAAIKLAHKLSLTK